MYTLFKSTALAAGVLAASAVAALAAPAVATAPLNVRAGPTTAAPVIGSLAPGQTVDAGGCGNGWCQVQGGYASARYLDFGGGAVVGGYYDDPGYDAYAYDGPYVYPSYGWGGAYGYYGRPYNRGYAYGGGRNYDRDWNRGGRGGKYANRGGGRDYNYRGGGGNKNVNRGGGGNKNVNRGGGGGGNKSANRGGGGGGGGQTVQRSGQGGGAAIRGGGSSPLLRGNAGQAGRG